MSIMKRKYWIAKGIVFVIVIVTLIGFVTMGLWNWLVPELFHGPVITFWQALGLFILSKILLTGFVKKNHQGPPWRHYWKDKWGKMTPEDRDRFKQRIQDKWCRDWDRRSGKDSGDSNV